MGSSGRARRAQAQPQVGARYGAAARGGAAIEEDSAGADSAAWQRPRLTQPHARPSLRAPPPTQHAQHAALTATGLLLLAVSLRSTAFKTQRLVLVPAVRLLLMSMPIARSASVSGDWLHCCELVARA